MAENRVELIVDARAAAADADIDKLKVKLNDLGRMVETARVRVDGDKEGELKVARMDAALLRLGRQVSNPKIKVDGAAKALADVTAVELSLDRLNDKGPGILSRLGSSFVSLGTEAGGLASTIGLILVPIGALVAIMSGPLIASLLPIIAGFATLGAVAIPEISKVVKALQAKGPAAKKAWAELSPPEKEIAGKIRSLKGPFEDLSKAVQPQILKAFGTGIGIIKELLPTLTPLAVAAGKALNGFLKHISDWLKSDSGKKFLHWMQTDGPKAIATFGRVMWDTAQAIGRTFSFLRNAGNSWWTNVRNGTASISRAVVNTWHVFVNAWHAIVASVHADVANIRATWAAIYTYLVAPVERAYNAISGFVSRIGSALGAIPGMIARAVASIPGGGLVGKALGMFGLEHGGIVGAADGGVHSGMRWVGERGPELVRLPTGSTVYPAGQSAAMAAQHGGGGGNTYSINVTVAPGGHPAETGRQIVEMIRQFEKRSGTSWRAA